MADVNEMLVFSGPDYAESCLDPKDAFYPNISLPGVLRLLDKKELLWGDDVGGAVLHWCFKEPHGSTFAYRPNETLPSLVILYNSASGFHFRFDLMENQLIACDLSAPPQPVLHNICGEPAFFPRCTFVSLAVAKGVVRKFVRDQSTYGRLAWIDSSGFNYHDPNAWKEFDARCRLSPADHAGNRVKAPIEGALPTPPDMRVPGAPGFREAEQDRTRIV